MGTFPFVFAAFEVCGVVGLFPILFPVQIYPAIFPASLGWDWIGIYISGK